MDSKADSTADIPAINGLLRKAREEIGMSVDDLAQATGLRPHVLRRMEQGDPRTTIRTVESCIVALEATGVRFRYAGDVAVPSYDIPGRKTRRPTSRPPKGKVKGRMPSFLPAGWSGTVERVQWGYRLTR